MLEVFWMDGMTNKSLVVLGNNVFANSLIGATIQDGGKRERSNDASVLLWACAQKGKIQKRK